MNAAPVIDISVNVNIPKCQTLKDDKKYKCTCCGNSWDVQKSHFSMSKSLLYQSNNGYINICNECRDKYYYQLIDLFSGSEEKAIQYMCQQFGWIYHIDALEASRQVSTDRSRISHYLAKKNLGQTANVGSTDIDTLKFEQMNRKNNVIESIEHLEQLKADGVASSSMASAERWGVGIFSDDDYKILDDHYKMLKKANPNCDSNQEIFIKSLCHLNLLQGKALRENNTENYIKANSEYAKTFKQAGLKTIQDTDKNADDCWGIFMEQISQYTPEEYYKDKTLYKDFDGIGELYTRFVLRPLKNLLCKTNERDKEYNVEDINNE